MQEEQSRSVDVSRLSNYFVRPVVLFLGLFVAVVSNHSVSMFNPVRRSLLKKNTENMPT